MKCDAPSLLYICFGEIFRIVFYYINNRPTWSTQQVRKSSENPNPDDHPTWLGHKNARDSATENAADDTKDAQTHLASQHKESNNYRTPNERPLLPALWQVNQHFLQQQGRVWRHKLPLGATQASRISTALIERACFSSTSDLSFTWCWIYQQAKPKQVHQSCQTTCFNSVSARAQRDYPYQHNAFLSDWFFTSG